MEKDNATSEFLSLVDVENYEDIYSKDISGGMYFGKPVSCIIEGEKRLRQRPSGQLPISPWNTAWPPASIINSARRVR